MDDTLFNRSQGIARECILSIDRSIQLMKTNPELTRKFGVTDEEMAKYPESLDASVAHNMKTSLHPIINNFVYAEIKAKEAEMSLAIYSKLANKLSPKALAEVISVLNVQVAFTL